MARKAVPKKKAKKSTKKKVVKKRVPAREKPKKSSPRGKGGINARVTRAVAKRKTATKKAAKGKAGALSRGKRSRIEKRLDELESAEKIIGRERIKKGRDLVGSTKWASPTKQGLATVDRIFKPLTRPGDLTLYSYDLRITFTGPNGKPINVERKDSGVPIFRRIARGKKMSKQQQFLATMRELTRRRIYEVLSQHFDIISPGKAVAMGKMSAAKAAKLMKDIRKGRNTRFMLTIYRHRI